MACKTCIKCPKCGKRKLLATFSITKDMETEEYIEKKFSYICKICNKKWVEFDDTEE